MEYDPKLDPVVTMPMPDEPVTGEQGQLTPTRTTWLLVAMWIAVYVGMTIVQGGFRFGFGPLGPGVIATPVAHEFGALTAREVAGGQVWRTVTATFIHLSLLHLICNLSCLIAFGRDLDSWYGGPQFFTIYLVIAALGNGFAVAGRYLLKGNVEVLCAGGSSVMFGLIALMAVVGWRAKSRFGNYIRRKMVGKLVIFGLIIGFFGRSFLDNYGHAGGALAGALVGLGHKHLIRWWDSRNARRIGFAISGVVVALCVAFQGNAGRKEYRVHLIEAETLKTQALLRRAILIRLFAENVAGVVIRYGQIGEILAKARGPFRSDPTIPFRKAIGHGLQQIEQIQEPDLPIGDPPSYSHWLELARKAVKKQPSPEDVQEFRTLSRPLQRAIAEEVHRLPKIIIRPQAPPVPKR